MECNKDEAVRAKQIAESRMKSSNFVEALKFATKAQKLFPNIENIAQILTVCEVHCAAQNKLAGSEFDWYAILQTERLADDATIKKQYRKLALLLHPDKNKFAGAEAAFKYIVEANRVLSDKGKRSLYDIKCGASMRTAAPKPPSHHSGGNGYAKKHDVTARNFQNNFHSQSTCWNFHQQSGQQTFWTFCQHCNTRYEYYKAVLNATLPCQRCSGSFIARDLGSQGVPPGYTWTSFNNQKEASRQRHPNAASESNGGHSRGEKNEDGYVAADRAKGDVGTSQRAAPKARESYTSTNTGSKRARRPVPDFKESCKTGNGSDIKDADVQGNSELNAGLQTRRTSRKKQHSYMETSHGDDYENVSKRARRNGSSNTIEVKRREAPACGGLYDNNNSTSFATRVGAQNGEISNEADGATEEARLKKKSKNKESHVYKAEASKSDLDDRKSKADNSSPLNKNVSSDLETFNCPDPEFSDFEKDRAENCFAINQIWAVYDPLDSMPRFYARIKKVFSHGFRLLITWLEADPDDQGECDWKDKDLPIACGKYMLGNSQETSDRLMFSHQMHCIKGSGRNSYLVYPRKGETWAVFRDWDIGWSFDPEKYSKYDFEFVEVLSDFTENIGIEVAYLGKVKGFVSLFQPTKQNGISSFFVPPKELYRFSHRIPSYKMTGDERKGFPSGSFELDPAGLPIKFFEDGDPGDVKMEDRMPNTEIRSSCHKSSENKMEVEEVMANESNHKAKMHESSEVARVSSILRRSPRGLNRKSMGNGQENTSLYMPEGVEEKEDQMPNIEIRSSCHKSSECKVEVEQVMANESIHKAKMHESSEATRVSSILRRSPRGLNGKSIGNGQENTSPYMPEGVKEKMEDRMPNTEIRSSCHKSSECEVEVEQVMANESNHKAKMHESSEATGVSSILRRSPRGLNRKSMGNGPENTSLCMPEGVKDQMEDRMPNTEIRSSSHKSSECKVEVEQVMANESIHKAKMHESSEAARVSSILRRSPRGLNRKSMGNGQESTSPHMPEGVKEKI